LGYWACRSSHLWFWNTRSSFSPF